MEILENQTKIDVKQLIKDIHFQAKAISYEGKYYQKPYGYQRFPTREVKIGNLYIGGNQPIRIQSMTTTSTLDIEATVKQTIELYEKGCEIIRITARNPKEARALEQIRKKLNDYGYYPSLVADIHFSPQTALIAADYVDKVRINPGNFADTKTFTKYEYTDEEYEKEILRIHDAFAPLIKKLKELGKSLRIGCNHGSLSDRIMNRYGDTPEGMVESVIEYIKIAEYYDFKDIVVSMKASHPHIMIQAYRMLIERFIKEKMEYPLHLGVTEAGDGKDGRLKSYAGIGLLLLEGIGDTIRVSLTEDPIYEVDAAREILTIVELVKKNHQYIYKNLEQFEYQPYPYEIHRKPNQSLRQENLGFNYPVKWILKYNSKELIPPHQLKENMPDYILIENDQHHLEEYLKEIPQIPLIYKLSLDSSYHSSYERIWINISLQEMDRELPDKKLIIANIIIDTQFDFSKIQTFFEKNKNKQLVIACSFSENQNDFLDLYYIYKFLNFEYRIPLCIYLPTESISRELLLSYLGIWGCGILFSGLGDLIFLDNDSMKKTLEYTSDILQITRIKLSRADFISCPSCGRTLFNLQETTQKIKSLTQHLKGVKIAIMGCIVNGLGEMADADFGYVGASPGMVNLYKGKDLVKRNIPEEKAPFALVELIKESGKWIEK